MKTPRRRKKNAAARLRPFWMLIGVLLLLAIAAGAGAALWPGFAPKSVEVTGNVHVDRADVLARAGIAGNVNMWLQNTRAIETRIEAIPYVARANVRRVPPATIVLEISERVPFATVLSGGQAVLVDREMRVLQPVEAPSELPAFVLPGNVALEPGTFLKSADSTGLQTLYDELIAAHVVPARLEYDRFGGAVATMRGGIKVLLGDEIDMGKKIALIDPILSQVVRKGKPADAIDLRAPNTPVVVYKT